MSLHKGQKGGSTIGLVLTLAVIAYGVFVGVQYTPLHLESNAINSILDSVEDAHQTHRLGTAEAVWEAIDRQLYINDMTRKKELFNVGPAPGGGWLITVNYVRDLNLLFTNKQISYAKSMMLR